MKVSQKLSYFLLLISTGMLFGNSAFAQNKCTWSTLNRASDYYQIGNFDSVVYIVEKCIYEKGFANEQMNVSGLHLLAKTYLELDRDSSAQYVTGEILDIEPDFKPDYLNDPRRFIKLLEEMKAKGSEMTVTTVSKKAENIYEAPATVRAINARTFRQRGYNDYEALLHDLAGFDISRSNGNLYSHIYQRGYRSINTNRTLFLVDGVEENDLWSSNVYLSRQYPLSNLKKVEVIYGPASTMYGSNAFLGVINLISKSPDDFIKAGKQLGTNIITGYGSYNTKYIDGSIAWRTKSNNISLSLTGRLFLSDEQDLSSFPQHDYKPAELTAELRTQYTNSLSITDADAVEVFLDEQPENTDFYTYENNSILPTDLAVEQAHNYDNRVYEQSEFADYTESYYLDAKLKVADFLMGWTGWKKAEGPGAQYTDLMFMSAEEGQLWQPVHSFFYVKYDKKLGDKISLNNYLRYKIHDFDKDNNIVRYRKNYLSGNFGIEDLMNEYIPTYDSMYLFQKSNQLREELKIVWQANSKINVLAGFEARFSSIQGDYTLSTDNNAEETGMPLTDIDGGNHFFSRDLGLYLQSGIRILPELQLTSGIRFDNNKIRSDEGYGSVFNPRLALVYSPKNFIFKAIYAEAFKDATNREKYSTAAGKRELPNPGLQPEKVKNIELSVGNNFNETVKLNAAFYRALYSNIIQEVTVQLPDGTQTNQNQAKGKAEIYGVNAFADINLNKWNIYANYTFTRPYMIDPKDSSGKLLTDSTGAAYNQLRIGDIADHRFNVGANRSLFSFLNFNLRCNFVGERFTGEGTTVPTNPETFSPYIVFNGSLRYTHKKSGLSLQFTTFNILNTQYSEPGLDEASGVLASQLIQNGRNFYINLNYRF